MPLTDSQNGTLAELAASGLSVYAFAKTKGISTASLYKWRKHAGQQSAPRVRASPFIRVDVTPSEPPAAAPFDLHVGPVRIVVGPGFNAEHLCGIVRALRSIQ